MDIPIVEDLYNSKQKTPTQSGNDSFIYIHVWLTSEFASDGRSIRFLHGLSVDMTARCHSSKILKSRLCNANCNKQVGVVIVFKHDEEPHNLVSLQLLHLKNISLIHTICSCQCSKCKGTLLQTYRTSKAHMDKYPCAPDSSSMIEDTGTLSSQIHVKVTDMPSSGTSQTFQEESDPDAMTNFFVDETSVQAFFDINDDASGGPPALVSTHQGALALVSESIPPAVLQHMLTMCADFECSLHDYRDVTELANSLDSSSDSSEEETVDIDIEVWYRLRTWSQDHHVGRDAMSELLSIFIDLGHGSWPTDWRTVVSRLNSHEQSHNQPQFQQASVTHVCGSCFLMPFRDDAIANVKLCPQCDVASLKCSRYQCQERCVVTSKLGKRSIATLKACAVCLASSLSFPMHRTFHFSIKPYLQRAFADRKMAYDCLAPFHGFFTGPLNRPSLERHCGLSFNADWLQKWREHMQSMLAPSELCHGSRFYNHPFWEIHGPRSILLVISLDWFPPFKSRDYSVGILTATIANLTTTLRADRANTWVLAVLEGPREPAHTFYCLAPVFLELRELGESGIEVYDALTESMLRVHISCGPVSADVPACAKLGDHRGHSGFQPCISCNHTGCLCGCKSKPDEAPVGRYDNVHYTQGRPKLLSGTLRPKRKGEHIVFVDHELVLSVQQRPDLVHRAGQLSIARFLERKDYTNAAYDRLRATTRSNGVSPMIILDPATFSFTEDMTIDAMHTVLKGVIQRLWRLCTHVDFKTFIWNIHHVKGNFDKLKERLISFKFPSGHTNPTSYADRANCLKAEELYVLVRVCGWLLFESLIGDDAVRVWYMFCRLYTNLLHTHVSRAWINHHNGLRLDISKAHASFESVFGCCHMPSNFHRILHSRLDFINWGPMRTHWTFPFERLYGALMLATKHCNRSSVTQSIVNAIPWLYCDRLNSHSVRAFRSTTDRHPSLLLDDPSLTQFVANGFGFKSYIIDLQDRTWRPGNLICVVRANHSVDEKCTFLIVGALQRNLSIISELQELEPRPTMLLILRQLTLKWLRIGPRLREQLLGLPEDYAGCLGPQSSLLFSDGGATSDCHVCGVVEYQYQERPTFVIPFCGMVSYQYDE